ncbi:tRNA-specific adenosine deaminase 1-like isoform X1 [Anopheles stephensi]|uniref:tRNA-specific adenosine deaminase 1-like isoform X1 n=1 Tax=Anopheles stephensi TaxID=30069 RepID=UPI00165876BA|nr:tRNA-specific adenosine deaminase 1-like isoform X1 [Anopheles stephensi]
MEINLANRIASACLAKFDSLPKTGKPNESFEWTILSAIVLLKTAQTKDSADIRVVALGTGTKCLAGNELSASGDRVHDSHAEVLARRAFLRYLLEQAENAASNPQESIFEQQTSESGGKLCLKNGHSFHFFTTHSPCGDASIFEPDERDEVSSPKRPRIEPSDEETNVGCCVWSVEQDKRPVGMTGGKLLQPDPAHGDLMLQTVGPVRTKPGRGVRTLSVSCSDKLARWNVLGVQGSLLMLLLDRPIYLESVVLCDGTDHSPAAIGRAIWGRFDGWAGGVEQSSLMHPFGRRQPVIIAANNGRLFRFRKNRQLATDGGKYQPAPCGIVWCDVANRSHEVEVAGRRHGVTKRKLVTPAARLQISKIELFNRFARLYCGIVSANPNARNALHNLVPGRESGEMEPGATGQAEDTVPKPTAEGIRNIAKLSYADAKRHSVQYAKQWTIVRESMFGQWTKKPDSL